MNSSLHRKHRYLRSISLIFGAWLCCPSLVAAVPEVAQVFFNHPDVTTATLSPSGERIATISYRDGHQRLSVTNIASGNKRTLLDLAEYSEGEAVASAAKWIDDSQLAVQYTEIRNGVDRLVDTRRVSYMLIVQLPLAADKNSRLLRVRTKGRLVSALPAEPNVFLYSKSGVVSRIYKIDARELSEVGARLGKLDKVDGGQFIAANQIASVNGFSTRWFLNKAGIPKAALTITSDRKIKLSEIGEDDDFNVIKEWRIDDDENDDALSQLIPVSMTADKNSYYCLRFDNGKRSAVYKVNFLSNEETLIYENDSHEISGLIMSETEDEILGVRVVRDGGLQNIYLGNADTQDQTATVQPSIDVAVGSNLAGTRTLQYREAHAQPGHYLIHDRQSGLEIPVGSAFPQLLDQLDSKLVDGRVTVEGLEIPYLLTLPGDTGGQPSPLIVMPHGGPIGVFDNRYFDLTTQFLAASGYAVLRVNYRGSSGYSTNLREAGKLQWGKLILEDIHAASMAVITRDDIDKSRVCAFGASYGGYAAIMLTIRHPDIYRCGGSLSGVTDINLHIETPYASESQRAWLKDNVGDSQSQYDELKAESPVYIAEQLKNPVQLVHGGKDETVDVEHAYRLHLALNKFGKAHEFKIYEEQGHGFDDIEIRREFYVALIAFFQTHIG